MDLLGLRDKLEIEVKLVQWVPKEKLEMWEDLVHQAFRDLEDLLAELDQEVLEVHQENQVNQGRMERMENQVLRDSRASQGQWVPLETKVPWENREGKEILVYQDSKDLEVIQARMELLVVLDHQGQLDQLVREEQQAVQDLVDSKECLALQAKMAPLEKMEQQECRGHQA